MPCFDVEHAPFFHGREALTDWLLDRLRPTPRQPDPPRFLAIVVASGSGKSSLARAGLVAALPSLAREVSIMLAHSRHSSYREKLLEHLFIGEILRHLWSRGVMDAEFLRPEVDNGGYDLVVACNQVIRHVQLKSSHSESKTARQNVHRRLAQKPSGCMVWLIFDELTLELKQFLWFGGAPGEPLPDVSGFPLAKHTKGNAQGIKAERPNLRVLDRKEFKRLDSIAAVVEKLFGEVGQPPETAPRPSNPAVPALTLSRVAATRHRGSVRIRKPNEVRFLSGKIDGIWTVINLHKPGSYHHDNLHVAGALHALADVIERTSAPLADQDADLSVDA